MIKERNVELVIIAITHGMNKDLHKRIVDAKVKGLAVYELPQILNVVKGDMAIVGPRPWRLWRRGRGFIWGGLLLRGC